MAKWKIWIGACVVVLVAAFLFLVNRGQAPGPIGENTQTPGENSEYGAQPDQIQSTAKPGTVEADIDATVNAMFAEANDDQTTAQAEEANTDVVTSDNQQIGDFGSAYDPNEL